MTRESAAAPELSEQPTEAVATRPATAGQFTRGDVAVLEASGVIPPNTPADVIRYYGRFCAEAQLNPFKRHVHLVKYSTKNGDRYVIQTGIDGYRSLAERTGCYLPGDEPTFVHDKDGRLVSATAYVMRLHGGTWHKIAATAYFTEFARINKEGHADAIWAKMPHAQLSKCAEALCLRKAFPDAIGPVYSSTEVRTAEFRAPAGGDISTVQEDLQPDPQGEDGIVADPSAGEATVAADGVEDGTEASGAALQAIGESKTAGILSSMKAAKTRAEITRVNQQALELYKSGEITNAQMITIGRTLNDRVKDLK